MYEKRGSESGKPRAEAHSGKDGSGPRVRAYADVRSEKALAGFGSWEIAAVSLVVLALVWQWFFL